MVCSDQGLDQLLEPKLDTNTYLLNSHMVFYSTCEVAQSKARSNTKFEAERIREGSRRKHLVLSNKKKLARAMKRRGCVFECCRTRSSLLEQRFRAPSSFEARASSDFERPVPAEHTRAMVSSGMWERATLGRCFRMLSNTKKPALAAISKARWLRSTLEQ